MGQVPDWSGTCEGFIPPFPGGGPGLTGRSKDQSIDASVSGLSKPESPGLNCHDIAKVSIEHDVNAQDNGSETITISL